MASERATALADDFAAANAEVMAFARSCSDAEWAVTVPGEEWTVGVVLHHIAEGHAHGAALAATRWRGATACHRHRRGHRPGQRRARRAGRDAGPDETVALLEDNGAPPRARSCARSATRSSTGRRRSGRPAVRRSRPWRWPPWRHATPGSTWRTPAAAVAGAS